VGKKYTFKDFLEIKRTGAPSFSPDGGRILLRSNATGVSQLYLLSLKDGEMKQLTDFDDGITLSRFSPVNEQVIFTMSEGGNERSQIYLLDVKTGKVKNLTDDEKYVFRFGSWSRDGEKIAYVSNQRNGRDFDAYVMDLRSGETDCVFRDMGNCSVVCFSPEGDRLIVSVNHSNFNRDLYLVDVKTKEAKLLTEHEGDVIFKKPKWKLDGTGFYYLSNEGEEFNCLWFFDIENGKRILLRKYGGEIEGLALSFLGTYLTVVINRESYDEVKVYDVESWKEIDFPSPKGQLLDSFSWSRDEKFIVYSFESSSGLGDIFLWSLEDKKREKVYQLDRKIDEETFVEPKSVRYKSFDGREISAFVYTPRQGGEGPFPAVVLVHGGPEVQFRPRFNSVVQYFVYQGYVVVAPNVRGSYGYGKSFMALDDRGKRMDSVKDLEWLHKFLKEDEKIDSERIALFGLIFQPDLWAAGVSIVGIINLVTFLQNTAAYRRKAREAEYGFLDKDLALLEKLSPINFIDNIKSPLMVIHGKNDPRVPLSESEQVVDKLKEKRIDVELLVYADEGHGLSKLKNRLDAYPKVIDFFDEHLR